MPVNFEATFTQPLLAKLDAGVLSDAKSWAEAITSAYITSISTGLPVGVPPSLPAPGLNPTTPPPFPIGVSSYNTANLRRKRMYKILYAYFVAREKKLDKASIKSLGTTIALLIKKIQARTRQARKLIEQIKMLKDQLKDLFKQIPVFVQNIKDEIKQQIQDIKDAVNSLEAERVRLSPTDFQALYSDELEFFEKLRSFDPTNIRNVLDLTGLLSTYGRRTDAFLSNFRSDMSTKKYIYTKFTGAASIMLQLAQGVINPSKILAVVNDLARKKRRVVNFAKRLNQFDLYVRFLRPKIRRLEIQVRKIIKEIKLKVKAKIKNLKDKLQKKINDIIKKKQDSKKTDKYIKAAKDKNERKKRNKEKIKRIRTKIKKLRKIYQLSLSIIGKSATLYVSAEETFKQMKEDILRYQEQLKVSERAWRQTYTDIQNLNLTNVSVQPNLNSPNINLDVVEQNRVETELKRVDNYMVSSGLVQFSNMAATVIRQTKTDYQTFIKFFEKNTRYVQQFVYELINLIEDIEKLAIEIKNFNKKQTPTNVKTKPPVTRLKSLKDALKYFATQVIPRIQRYPKWAKTQTTKEKNGLLKYVEKFKQELKISIVNALPIKSDVQDPKDKKEEFEGKMRTIRNRVKQVRRLLRLASYVARMAKGGITIYGNIQKGDYSLVTNDKPINTMIDSYYLLKSDGQPAGVQAALLKEKGKVKNDLKGIALIDLLVRALIDTFKDPNSNKIVQELTADLQDLKNNPPALQTLTTIKNLFESPPSTPKELIDSLNSLTFSVLQDNAVLMRLVRVEKKYLNKTKETIKTLLDVRRINTSKFGQKLRSLMRKLNKTSSYIMLFVDFIKSQIKKFGRYIKKKILNFIEKQKKKNKEKIDQKKQQASKDLLTNKSKKENSDAFFMTFVFSFAARSFWVGAGWIGPTGSQHRTFTVGGFRPRIKAKPSEGASAMIRQISKGYQIQLATMRGMVTPPANTGIPPIPFNGYK